MIPGSQRVPGVVGVGFALAREMAPTRRLVRDANGLRTLLGLLHARPSSANLQPVMAEKLRALAAQTLLGLAQDPDIRHTLTKLQVLLDSPGCI